MKPILHPRVEAEVRQAIGSVSGCFAGEIEDAPASGRRKPGDAVIEVTGWSPSLHGITMAWTVNVPGTAFNEHAAVMKAIRGPISLQRQRLEQGLALGHARPFPSSLDGIDAIEISHLKIDRGLAMLMKERAGDGLSRQIREMVYNLHTQRVGGLDKILQNDDLIEDFTLQRMVSVGPGLLYNGDCLWINMDLPEAVKTAMVGRRLGEIAEVPPAIRDYRVTSTCEDCDSLEILVEPDLVPVLQIAEGP